MKALLYLLVLCLGLRFLSVDAATLTLKLPDASIEKDKLIVELLLLSLESMGHDVRIEYGTERLTAARMAEKAANGDLDLFWAGMSPELENTLLPIRIPIFKGILGHRIFVIRADQQYRFENIDNIEALSKLRAGQGRFWGDTEVLQRAGLNVVTAVKGESLWPMLDGGRFDYFPLAIHEPWHEIEIRPELPLTVENNILLVYPFAMYFYVAADNHALHSLVSEAMNWAIESGAYDRYLYQHPLFKGGLEQAKVTQRRTLRIDNPNMHSETPVNIEKYWLDVTKLDEYGI